MEGINMENYIVINGERHDVKRQQGVKCEACSLLGYCGHIASPCAFFAQGNWQAMKEIFFVLHSNS